MVTVEKVLKITKKRVSTFNQIYDQARLVSIWRLNFEGITHLRMKSITALLDSLEKYIYRKIKSYLQFKSTAKYVID